MNLKAAIYTRVSTEGQAVSGYGLDVQLAKCKAMATVKDYDTVTIQSDKGASGRKDEADRPGLAEILRLAETGEIEMVIVHSLDRLGRNTRLVLSLVEQLETFGVGLVSCREVLDTTSPTGRFVLRMFASLGELELDNIVEQMTAGRDARGRIDGEKGGSIPWGYVRFDGVSVDQTAARWVKEVFSRIDSGASMLGTAKWLNAKKVPTPKGGAVWYASTISAVLSNREKYEGGRRGESPVRWPKII